MKLLLIVVGFFILVLPSGKVFAQDVSPSAIPQHVEDRMRKDHSSLRELTQKEIQHKQEVEKKHQEVKDHLKQVQNKHHAQVAEKIHVNFNHVNETLTSAWLKNLNHMSEILIRLEDHLSTAAGEGRDVAQARTALTSAKTKVAEAENALKIQASKVYTITITDPKHIGSDVKTARDILHADLKNVHQVVKNAQDAVIEATKAAKQVTGGNNGQ